MSSVDRRVTVTRFARPVLFLLLLLLLSPAGVNQAGPADHKVKTDAEALQERNRVFRSALRSMPWYDSARDDYHRYDPETVRKAIPNTPKPRTQTPRYGISPEALQMFGYVFVGTAIAVLLFFLVRFIQEREAALAVRKVSSSVRHGSLVDDALAARIPLEEGELARSIAATLETDPRRAAVLLFVYAVLVLARKEVHTALPHSTAREAVRALQADPDVSDRVKLSFAEAGRAFEEALYAERVPGVNLIPLWQFWQEFGRT